MWQGWAAPVGVGAQLIAVLLQRCWLAGGRVELARKCVASRPDCGSPRLPVESGK